MRPLVVDAAACSWQSMGAGPGALCTVIDGSATGGLLEQRLVRINSPTATPLTEARDHVMYVITGQGAVLVDGARWTLRSGTGVFVPAGRPCLIAHTGSSDLLLVSVLVAAEADEVAAVPAVVRIDEQPAQRAGDRTFRYGVTPAVGCRAVTQFTGSIPPGGAPPHHHEYDEVLYIVEGSGVAHVAGTSSRIAAGTCLLLPRREPHCLENTGDQVMQVMGVFHPAGSPAAKYEEPGAQAAPST
jgi:mannose-6-phosphate isomerase-like protein (cupin superfamily)